MPAAVAAAGVKVAPCADCPAGPSFSPGAACTRQGDTEAVTVTSRSAIANLLSITGLITPQALGIARPTQLYLGDQTSGSRLAVSARLEAGIQIEKLLSLWNLGSQGLSACCLAACSPGLRCAREPPGSPRVCP